MKARIAAATGSSPRTLAPSAGGLENGTGRQGQRI